MASKQIRLKWDSEEFDVMPFIRNRHLDAEPIFRTSLGALFSADCMNVLPQLKDEVVDTVFADPPFNLGKEYGKNTNDKIPATFATGRTTLCVRTLKIFHPRDNLSRP